MKWLKGRARRDTAQEKRDERELALAKEQANNYPVFLDHLKMFNESGSAGVSAFMEDASRVFGDTAPTMTQLIGLLAGEGREPLKDTYKGPQRSEQVDRAWGENAGIINALTQYTQHTQPKQDVRWIERELELRHLMQDRTRNTGFHNTGLCASVIKPSYVSCNQMFTHNPDRPCYS